MFTILPHISRVVFAGSIGFVCGVIWRSFYDLPSDILFFVVALIGVGCTYVFYKKPKGWFVVIFLLGVCFGVFVIQERMVTIEKYRDAEGQTIVGEACVSDDLVQKQWYTEVRAQFVDKDIKVLIKDEKYPQISQGDILSLSCAVTVPENIDEFDYRMYLAMHGVYYICSEYSYDVVGRRETMGTYFVTFRHTMEQIIDRSIPSPQAGLANGLLFGGDDRLSDTIQKQFARTGLTHVVAVSGYNVSVIIGAIMGVVIFCGSRRKMAVVLAIVGVVGFVFLIGLPSSGVRATIMGIMVLVAATFGRISQAYNAVFFVAALMLLHNPLLLRYDVGFQLSFLATMGIIFTYPFFESFFVARKSSFGIFEIVALTISAQVFVVPIIMYHFHTVATLSLIANILVLPIIPFTMLAVFLLIVFSYIFPPVAVFCGWVAYFLLSYEIMVVRYCASISWSAIDVPHVYAWWVGLYYGILACILFYFHKKYEAKKDGCI
jgi:competence protein ComEC